ncbi:MAG: acyl-CoA dehydrogenase family protein [Phycisphaerales bacterium]|nr:acyl-CoA dehydrogenase family protein [Phycisphaerales bacterium]
MSVLDSPIDHSVEAHDGLVQAVREFARSELIDLDRRCDREESSCCVEFQRFCEMGLTGLRIPESFGGLDCPAVTYAHLIRELAYASPSVAVTLGVHNMVGEIIAKYAHEPLRSELLPKLVEPDNLTGFAISEPDAGSDTAAAKTRAEKVAGGWKLFGNKMWVTNGMTGRWFCVLARTGEVGGKDDFSMLLLDARQAGVKRAMIKGKMGIRGSETAEWALDGAFVPESNMLGKLGDGRRIGLTSLGGGRIGIASQALGIAQACLDEMARYARQREQFGRPIADFQAIQWMIADSATEIAAAQQLIDRAAAMKDAGRKFAREGSMAKLFASEAANRIAYRAVQVHGGSGFVNDCRVEQLYRDARITTIYEGTSEVQRIVISRELVRE